MSAVVRQVISSRKLEQVPRVRPKRSRWINEAGRCNVRSTDSGHGRWTVD